MSKKTVLEVTGSSHFCKALIFFLIALVTILPISDSITVALARFQDKCEAELKEAQEKYDLGLLDETIRLVSKCLDQEGVSLEESQKAYKLMGKAYHAKGILEEAKKNIRKLLELIPNWRPSPETETPTFRAFVADIIREMETEKKPEKVEEVPLELPEEKKEPEQPQKPTLQPEKKGGKTFLWLALGAVAIGGGLAIGLGGGGNGPPPPVVGDPRLPNPPGAPD